jgi:hypothetical protein
MVGELGRSEDVEDVGAAGDFPVTISGTLCLEAGAGEKSGKLGGGGKGARPEGVVPEEAELEPPEPESAWRRSMARVVCWDRNLTT